MELNELTAVRQHHMLIDGEASATELLDAHLAQIERVNPTVNALVALDVEVAQRRAHAVDTARANGLDLGPLAGLVTAHKDLTETADFDTTYGLSMMRGHRPPNDSLLVSRMKAAGALAIGKTNTPEWGAGSHTFNPVYGATTNAHAPGRSAGGSSGGAAVALARHFVAIADGSDMGGSLRNPAAWNGVVGMRPSRGVVPNVEPGNGWSTLATDGPMARNVADLYLLMRVIGAPDWRDPMCRQIDWPTELMAPSRPLRVAYSPTLEGLPVETEIRTAIDTAVERIAHHGWRVTHAEPSFVGADEAFETLRSWSFAAGIGRFAGERLGEVKAVIRDEVARGRALTPDHISAALGHLRTLWARGVAFFDQYDLLVAPVTQCSPFPIEWEYPESVAGTPMERYITWMRSCSRVTMLGLPALSLPVGRSATGMPVGLQLVAGPWHDLRLLRAAQALEPVLGSQG